METQETGLNKNSSSNGKLIQTLNENISLIYSLTNFVIPKNRLKRINYRKQPYTDDSHLHKKEKVVYRFS